MKTWAHKLFLTLSVMGAFAATGRADVSKATPIRDTRMVIVPSEVRADQEAVIVLDGYIGDSCQKLLAPVVKTDLDHQSISVTPMTERIGTNCREIYLHYRLAVSLGKLPEGHYMVETFDRQFSVPLSVISAR